MSKPKYVNPQEKHPFLLNNLAWDFETPYAIKPLFDAVLDFYNQLDAYLPGGKHIFRDLFLADMDALVSYCFSLAPTGIKHVDLYNAMFNKNTKLSELDAHIKIAASSFDKNSVPESYKRLEEEFGAFDLTPEDVMEAMDGYWLLINFLGHDMGESHGLKVTMELMTFNAMLSEEEKAFARRFGKQTPGEIRIAARSKK